jgi:hypothetical protein
VEPRDQRAPLAVGRERLARTIHELVADLATSRRDCREKQRKIDSLKAENARLIAGSSAPAGRDDQDAAAWRGSVGDERGVRP